MIFMVVLYLMLSPRRYVQLVLCSVLAAVLVVAHSASVHADEEKCKDGELSLTRFYTRPTCSFNRVRFGGSLRFSNYTYPYAVPQTDIRTSNRLISKLFMDMRVDEHLRLYGEVRIRTDLPQSTVRTGVNPLDVFADVNIDRLNIRGGYQIFSWGVADIYNPTDVLNPRDYTDIFDFEKLGIPALRLAYTMDKVTLEGYWMPIPEESDLPFRDSRFVQPFLTTINNPLFPVIGIPPANYDVRENVLAPEISIRNSQFGARVLATVWKFDLGLSYFNGFEKVPHQEVVVGSPNSATGQIPAVINQVYLRKNIIGFNIATGFEGLNLNSESALVIPYNNTRDVGGADQTHFIYSLGADYTFFDIVEKHDFSIIMEFVHQINTKPNRQDFADLFQKTLFGRLEYRIADYFRMRFTSIYNFDNRSYYLQPEIMWEPIDNLELKLGANLLDGPSDTLFGLFDRQDRFYFVTEFFF